MPRNALIPVLCLMSVGSLLGLSIVISKLADQAGAPLLWFLALVMAGSGAVLAVLALQRGQQRSLSARAMEYGLVTGGLLALTNGAGFLAVRHVGAGFISLSYCFPILITYAIALAVGLERLSGLKLAAVGLALAGGLVLALSRAAPLGLAGEEAGSWVALVAAIPFVIAAGNIYRTLRWPEGAGAIWLAMLMLLAGAGLLIPVAVAREGWQVARLFTDPVLAGLLILDIAVFAVQYVLYFVLQRVAGPVYFSQLGQVAALSGTLIAVLMLGEAIPPNLGPAALLIAGGVLLFQRARAAKPA